MLLIYGVTGYTGQLVLDECPASGLHPVVAGRDAAARIVGKAEADRLTRDTPQRILDGR